MEDDKYGGSRDRENLMYHDYEHSDYGRSDSAGNVEQRLGDFIKFEWVI